MTEVEDKVPEGDSKDEILRSLEAVKKYLEKISYYANIIADELKLSLKPSYPLDEAAIIRNKRPLAGLLLPVVPTEMRKFDIDVMAGFGVPSHTVFSFFCCSITNPNVQRWARWLLRLLEELEGICKSHPYSFSKEYIEAWQEAIGLMNTSIQKLIKEDFPKFGGQKDHLEEFINKLRDGPENQKLTQAETALLAAYLKQPELSQRQQQSKLKLILDYNIALQSLSSTKPIETNYNNCVFGDEKITVASNYVEGNNNAVGINYGEVVFGDKKIEIEYNNKYGLSSGDFAELIKGINQLSTGQWQQLEKPVQELFLAGEKESLSQKVKGLLVSFGIGTAGSLTANGIWLLASKLIALWSN